MPTSYRVSSHGRMVADSIRMQAYAEALRQCVQPGEVVIDLGCGTGVMILLALQAGAGRVEAIEPSDSVRIAQETANEHGVAERVHFHSVVSQKVTLAQKADVLIADLRGPLPLLDTSLATLIDARDRLLKPRGTIIARRDRIWCAPIDNQIWQKQFVQPYVENAVGLTMESAARAVREEMRRMPAGEAYTPRWMASPQLWWELDYRTLDQTDHEATLTWSIEEGVEANGLAVWFESELAEGIEFSNRPGGSSLIYGWMFFPWRESLSLQAGDQVRVRLRAKLQQSTYVWVWETKHLRGEECRSHFAQTSFRANGK